MTYEMSSVEVVFRVTFTADEVDWLSDAAEHHYDPVCRTFLPLKTLASWRRSKVPLDITLGWHDLDILSKICESPLCPEKVARDVQGIFTALREKTQIANDLVRS